MPGTTNGNPDVTALPSAYGDLYIGTRFLCNASGSENFVWGLRDAGTSQVQLNFDGSAGTFKALRAGTLLGTASGTYSNNVWYYVEAHIVISDTVGVFELKVNGTQVLNLTGIDTRNAGTTVNQLNLAGNGICFLDDMYVNDTTGTVNTAYSGDIRISAYIPNADGTTSGMTLSTGTSHFAVVDERPPNTSDYAYGTGTTEVDTLNVPNTVSVATVQAVTLWLYAAKSDAGAGNIATVLKSSATTDTGTDQALSTSYAYYYKVYNQDPNGPTNWTASAVDSMEIGAKSR